MNDFIVTRVPKILCAANCGTELPYGQHVCRECAEGILRWQKSYDGPMLLNDDTHNTIIEMCQRAIQDEKAV